MAESPLAFSKIQRIVLLIDLTPLLQNPNPNYLTSILTSSKRLLSFPPLSSSLFAFKFFFSSLSPLRSSSVLHRLLPRPPSASLSFNNPHETLPSLSTTLNSLSTSEIPTELTPSPSRASHTASSLLQLVHDYAWESQFQVEDDLSVSGTRGSLTPHPEIRSNLVVLFSPICRSIKCLSEYMSDESLRNSDGFCAKFCNYFRVVNDAFVIRDIHLSWIDVNYEKEINGEIDESLFVQNGIRNLGWGLCSTDSVVLGSALIPFGLIFPNIGTSFSSLNHNGTQQKRICGELSLEILDVSGKPLEYKCCDLELLNLKLLPKARSGDIGDNLKFGAEGEGLHQNEGFWSRFGDETLKLHLKAVHRDSESEKLKVSSSDHILVQEYPGESGKSTRKSDDGFSATRVLELLSKVMDKFFHRKSIPIWQILLSFLYREGCWASVCISSSNGNSCMGILKPFTAHLALLSITDNNHTPVHDSGDLAKLYNLNSERLIGSQTKSSSSQNHVPLRSSKRTRNTKHSYQDLTWSSFSKAAFECTDFDLAEAYFSKDVNNSKKVKFLKCWMKQIRKGCYSHVTPDGFKSDQHAVEKATKRCDAKPSENGQLMPQTFPSEPCRMQDGAAGVSHPETSEAFFFNLPKKIQHGVESKGVDLQIMAGRLVDSSIHWLHQKRETGNKMESHSPTRDLENHRGRVVAAELIKLLLTDLKVLKEKHTDNDSQFQESLTGCGLDKIVREYELQILLRLEILRSGVALSIEEVSKKKLEKQICSLLEIIQYLVEGGLHGHVSLYDYVERTIKTRYAHILGDVVNRIYAEMDLLPFGDYHEDQILLFNSEDSSQSWREKRERYEIGKINRSHESVSAEYDSFQPLEKVDENPQGTRREEHARKLDAARERRERAKRFGSFTSWIPDLQRVWAPKQPKGLSVKSEALQKDSKRKKRRRASYSVVHETPMTAKNLSCSQGSSIGDEEEYHDNGTNSNNSVSKALFQDDR